MTSGVVVIENAEPLRRRPISDAALDEIRSYLNAGRPAVYILDRASLLALVLEIDRLRAIIDERSPKGD